MKKILTVSLVAMMAVSAARADIASTDFVTGKTGDMTGYVSSKTTLTGAVNDLDSRVTAVKSTADAAATKTALQELTTTVEDIDEAYKAADTTLTNKFGDLGEKTVQAYVDDKTKDIASSSTVSELAGRVDTLTGAATVEGSVANAKQAGTDAAAALTTYKGEMATTLAGKQDTLGAGDITTDLIADKNVTKAKLSDEVQASLDLADKAVQPAAISDMQVKSNIYSDANTTLQGEIANTKYPSVAYVDAKVSGINGDLSGVNNTLTEHAALITEAQDTAEANALAIQNLDSTYVTDAVFTTFQTDNTTAIADAKKAGTDAQADLNAYKTSNGTALADVKATADANAASIEEMDLTEVKSDGMAIVSISEANGKVSATTGTIKNAGIAADAAIEQSKIAGLADSLSAATAAALTQLADKATDGTDGVYTLTMKQVGGVKTLVWEKIAR